jgi:hypothetical protein
MGLPHGGRRAAHGDAALLCPSQSCRPQPLFRCLLTPLLACGLHRLGAEYSQRALNTYMKHDMLASICSIHLGGRGLGPYC